MWETISTALVTTSIQGVMEENRSRIMTCSRAPINLATIMSIQACIISALSVPANKSFLY